MKKTILITLMTIFTLGATTTFAAKTDVKDTPPVATEKTISAEELSTMRNRVEEINDMDKSEMSAPEKRELRNEKKGIKKDARRGGEFIYIGGTTLLLIILIIILI